MVGPAARGRAVEVVCERVGLSERRACAILGQPRSTQRRLQHRNTGCGDRDRWLREWLHEFAHQSRNQRKGYRRAWADLRDEGHVVNRKKVQRIWREEVLRVVKRRRRKRTGHSTIVPPVVSGPNQVWAIDFQYDATADGRQFKIASMLDEHTRESILNIVDRSITAERLKTELDAVIQARGKPVVLRCDNGPELISGTLREFCARTRMGISYIPPGEPWNNGLVESFNNRVRDECLNLNQFHSLLEARVVIKDWKHDYNQYHRHSSLGYLTPNEYASKLTKQTKVL